MEEKKKCKECWNCGNFHAYYTKGFCHFDKTDCGFCAKHREIKGKHEECEFWKNAVRNRSLRKAVAQRALTDLLVDLTSIKQILEEDREEKNEM